MNSSARERSVELCSGAKTIMKLTCNNVTPGIRKVPVPYLYENIIFMKNLSNKDIFIMTCHFRMLPFISSSFLLDLSRGFILVV